MKKEIEQNMVNTKEVLKNKALEITKEKYEVENRGEHYFRIAPHYLAFREDILECFYTGRKDNTDFYFQIFAQSEHQNEIANFCFQFFKLEGDVTDRITSFLNR